MAKFAILRQTTFNGVLIESDRFMGISNSRAVATKKAESYQDMVLKNTAVCGLSFTFYVREVSDIQDEVG